MKAIWNKPRKDTVNVTVVNPRAAGLEYGNYAYASIASFVLPTLHLKAVRNNEYKQRYCYNTAAN
jgi:hypothetical protein